MDHQYTFARLVDQVNPIYLRDFLYVKLFDNIGIVAVAFGFCIAGFVASWIVYKLMIYFGLPSSAQAHFRVVHDATGAKRLETYDHDGKLTWQDIDAQPRVRSKKANYRPLFYSARTSVVHFAALVVRYSIVIFAFYVAFGAAGISVFSLAYSVGIVGLVGAYSFGTVLNNTAGAFVMTGTGRFVENMVVEVHGIKGKIMEISSLFTTMSCVDKKTGAHYLANVPNRYFNEEIVLRFPEEEPGMDKFKIVRIESEPPRAKVVVRNLRV